MTSQLALDSTDEIVRLGRRLDSLHQLLYTRGGIRPSNAAVEELSKLLLVRIATHRHPYLEVAGFGPIAQVMSQVAHGDQRAVDAAKGAFRAANLLPALGARLPDGTTQTIWPPDEPLRVSRADVLREAVDILWGIELGGLTAYDPIGMAFDVFLRGRYENAGGLGTYLTPETVVNLMVSIGLALVTPSLGSGQSLGLVGDPCCGSGRFLVALAHRILASDLPISASALPTLLFGADQSTSSVAMARVNLMAAGFESPEVFAVEDSITDRWVSSVEGTFSLVLTNPPFGDGKYDDPTGISVTAAVLPGLAGSKRIDPALAFVARCVNLLRPNGVLGIILPDGVLDGPTMRTLAFGRDGARPQLSLEGVVSLPSATFAPAGTTAKTSIAFLRKTPPTTPGRVFLARADHVGYVMRKGAVAVDPEGDDLPEIAESILRFLNEGPQSLTFAKLDLPEVADLTSLDASSFSVESAEARHELHHQGGRECAGFLDFRGRRRVAVRDDVPFVSVLHVDELGSIDWASAQQYRPSTPGQLAHPGDVIVSLLNPAKFRAAVIPPGADVVHCSAEFGVFRSRINPFAALALLQHPLVKAQASPLGRGTSSSRRRIEPDDLLALLAPPFTDEWVATIGPVVERALTEIDDGKKQLAAAYGLGVSYPPTGTHSPEESAAESNVTTLNPLFPSSAAK